jgi:hypothetical protein
MHAVRRTTALAVPVVVAAATLVLAAPSAHAVRYMDPVAGTSSSVGCNDATGRAHRIAALGQERRAATSTQAKTVLHNEIRLAENAVRDL